MLNYTGHPLVDVGIATITAFAEKDDPSELSEADLDKVAQYIALNYIKKPLIGFLQGSIFPNSAYTNPGIKTEKDRLEYLTPILYSYRRSTASNAKRCGFCGNPAIEQVSRDYIPLLMGRGGINFYPEGDSGLPVCGNCLVSIQAYPLGAGGLMLVVHSDNEEITWHFANAFLQENRKKVYLAQQAEEKLSGTDFSRKTLLINTLLEARVMQQDYKDVQEPFSISAYQISNYGPKASLEIFHLPFELVAFLREMESAEYHQKWYPLIWRAWEVEPHKKKAKENAEPFKPRRNWLYEDLFDLPDNAAKFIRTYFLRLALHYAKSVETDPRGHYSTQIEAALVSWKVTAKFLERIIHMDKERIEQIKKLGDTLAEYVNGQNDRRFFREFFTVQRYDYFRNTLVKANLAHARRGHAPMITFEAYISVFEDGEDLARLDWKLARDLVLIRMVEQLHTLGWLGKNADAIPENVEETPPLADEPMMSQM